MKKGKKKWTIMSSGSRKPFANMEHKRNAGPGIGEGLSLYIPQKLQLVIVLK